VLARIVAALEVGGFQQESLRRAQTGDGEAGEDVFARVVAQAERDGFTELACNLRKLATRVGRPEPSDAVDPLTRRIPSPPVATINAA
jgi:hypothetical protein